MLRSHGGGGVGGLGGLSGREAPRPPVSGSAWPPRPPASCSSGDGADVGGGRGGAAAWPGQLPPLRHFSAPHSLKGPCALFLPAELGPRTGSCNIPAKDRRRPPPQRPPPRVAYYFRAVEGATLLFLARPRAPTPPRLSEEGEAAADRARALHAHAFLSQRARPSQGPCSPVLCTRWESCQ